MYKKTALLQTGINKYQSSQSINRDRLNLALHMENTGPQIFVTENRRRINCRRRTAELSERFLHPVNDTLARGETFPNLLETLLLAARMAIFPQRREPAVVPETAAFPRRSIGSSLWPDHAAKTASI